MPPLVFLGLAALCSLIGRCLMIKAAWSVSARWGVGIFLPFGPYFFRRQFPEDVQRARMFQLAALPLLFIYVLVSPELIPDTRVALVRLGPVGQQHYAIVAGGRVFNLGGGSAQTAAAEVPAAPEQSLEERRAANEREFVRLAQVSESLRVRKRDLLNSDRDGAIAYNNAAAEYNAGLEKATSEKLALEGSVNQTAAR